MLTVSVQSKKNPGAKSAPGFKRNANGTFEAKFVDRVRVLTMLRELLDERRDGALSDFLDGLYQPQGGDER